MEEDGSVSCEIASGEGREEEETGRVMAAGSEGVMIELEDVLGEELTAEVGPSREGGREESVPMGASTASRATNLRELDYTVESMDDGDMSQRDIAAALMKESEPGTASTSPMLASAVSADAQTPASVKETIILFAGKYSVNQAAKRFGVPSSTIKRWIKGDDVQMRPKFNSPGQGRKLSYSKETDQAIADHVKALLAKGERMTVQELCSYAKSKIQEQNPHFNASTGWAQRFLPRHGISLGNHRPKRDSEPTTSSSSAKTETKVSSDTRGRPLSYSSETDQAIAGYVRERKAEGQTLSNSELRRYAKERILKENPNFTGSASWAQNFLLRHKLTLNSPSGEEGGGANSLTSSPLQLSSHSPPPMSDIASGIGDGPLGPVAEITPTSVSSVLAEAGPSVDSDYPGVSMADDPMKAALAILTGENIDTSSLLNSAQAAALQSTLNELTATESISLVDLLSSAQQLQDQSGGDGTVALITQALEPPSSNSLFLGLSGASDAFASGLSCAAATHVNPNTQAPLFLLPRLSTLELPRATSVKSGETLQANRPLSYTKETDQLLANWVQQQQAAGKKVTFASLRAYAKKLVSNENPNFNASVGWVTPFLLRHNLDLSVNQKKKTPRKSTPRKIEASTPGEGDEGMLDDAENVEEGEELPVALSTASEMSHVPISSGVGQTVPVATCIDSLPQQSGVPLDELTIRVAENPLQLAPLPPSVQEPPPPQGLSGPFVPSPQTSEGKTESPKEGVPEEKPAGSLKKSKGQRARHTLAEKLEVVRLMKEYNIAAHYVCRMLGLANSTVAGWIKLVNQKGAELEQLSMNKKRANVSGQGRPLSYSREKDEAIARWVRAQQSLGVQITSADLTKYATGLIGQENTSFTASSGWQQKFLQRHNLQLSPRGDKLSPLVEDQQNIPTPVQTEEVVTHEFTTNLLEKPYSDEIDEKLVLWVKGELSGNAGLSVQALCQKAEELVVVTNPMFVATLGWAFKFLHRHGLMLDPRPSVSSLESPGVPRKRFMDGIEVSLLSTPKKLRTEAPDVSVSPSTGNLCEALLALSNQSQEGGGEGVQTVQAAVQAMQNAVKSLQDHLPQLPQEEAPVTPPTQEHSSQSATSSTYFGKPAREFSPEEKEEVVRFANATTLQKAALKYGVAAPTVWRWRVELKLHQPKYTPMQKKYIIKFAETNSLREASQRYGITGKTIQNWRRALQADGELGNSGVLLEEGGLDSQGEMSDPAMVVGGEGTNPEMVTYDTQNFQIVVDGGEVVETGGARETSDRHPPQLSLEVTHEMDIENVGMEYDVVSSEGHAAKPRCTHQEKALILDYALKHSIKEASQKFGISPGTLYYWKKNFSGSAGGEKHASLPSGAGKALCTPTTTSLAVTMDTESESTEEPIVDVEFPGITGETAIMPAVNPATVIATENLSIPPSHLLSASAAATPENLQALSQTLASMTPEVLQNLPADISLLQAVSSLLSQQGGEVDDGRGGSHLQKAQKSLRNAPRHESTTSGGISSPTEVLVTPFQPPISVPHVASTEEVQLADSPDGTAPASGRGSPAPPHSPSQACPSVLSLQISEIQGQPAVGESVEIKTAPPPSSLATSQPLESDDSGGVATPEVTEVVELGEDVKAVQDNV